MTKKLLALFLGISLAAGTSLYALATLEDEAAVSGDSGTSLLGVRRDTAASSTATDGDYGTLNLDASGRLWTNGNLAGGTVAISNIAAGTVAVSNVAGGTIAVSNIAAGTIAVSNIAAGTIAVSNVAGGTIAVSSFTNIGGTVAHYYSTANANSVYWNGTTGATFTEFTIKAGPGAIKSVECDGTPNNELSFLTFYDELVGPVTVGTTFPKFQITCGGGTISGNLQVFPTSKTFGEGGVVFTTGITGAVCKNRACSSDVDTAVPVLIEYK